MIAYLEGTLVQKTPTHLVVDVNGVGYLVRIPLSSYDRAGAPGDTVRVLTYLHVREECMELYGFMTENERELFRSLIVVPGVGPRLAQSILSGLDVADFRHAVSREDLRLLTSVPGVGKKTAQRLILELKERFDRAEALGDMGVAAQAGQTSPQEDALRALLALGYEYSYARRMIEEASRGLSGEVPVGQLVKLALKRG